MQLANTVNLSVAMADSAQDADDKLPIMLVKEDVVSFKQTSQKVVHSIAFRAMIIFQVVAYGSYSVLVHLCEKNNEIMFSSTTMNFVLEFVKLSFSVAGLACSFSANDAKLSPSVAQLAAWFWQSLPYAIPGFLYFLNNNLAVHMQLHMDPASYQILANFKIVTTAILYRVLIKHKLTRKQWFALSLLFFGGVTYSLGTIRNSSLAATKPYVSSGQSREMYISPWGIPMIAVYCTLSGLAGVYNEYILKKHYSESLHLQNLFLYSYGTILNLIPAVGMTMISSQHNRSFDLFRGFSLYTWLIVFSQALNGLFMSVVIKHSSNIIRLFIISFSLVVTAVLSFAIFHITFNIYFYISFVTMTCALSLYYS